MPAVLSFKIENNSPLRKGLAVRFVLLLKEALRDTAFFWLAKIFPRHFFSSNRAKYHHEARNQVYLDKIKKFSGVGPGKYVDLLLSGRSRRQMMAFARISGSKDRQTVLMRPPGYFANPFIGVIARLSGGRVKQITRQPDKAAEVTRVVDEERTEMNSYYADRLVTLLKANQAPQVETITG